MTTAGEDQALVARVAAVDVGLGLEQLSAECLRDFTAREGIDFATTLVFDRVQRSPRHAAFIAQIEELQRAPRPFALPRDALVAIVPAPFYREQSRSGADGRVVRDTATALGLASEVVPVHSAGTLRENATILVEWLRARQDRPVILATLCKGGADVKSALAQPGAADSFRSVAAWINICGTLNGSHVAGWLLRSRGRFMAAWMYCRCQGHSPRFLRELVPGSESALAAPLRLPEHLRLVSIVGFPLRRHLTNAFMRRCHAVIAPQGPNDGGVLLSDVCGLPGSLYPVWGADHYLRPEARARQILGAMFGYLAEEFATGSVARPESTASVGR